MRRWQTRPVGMRAPICAKRPRRARAQGDKARRRAALEHISLCQGSGSPWACCSTGVAVGAVTDSRVGLDVGETVHLRGKRGLSEAAPSFNSVFKVGIRKPV